MNRAFRERDAGGRAPESPLARAPSPRPTVPSTLGDERQCNPFLRVHEPALASAVGSTDPVEVMARLRAMKDVFK